MKTLSGFFAVLLAASGSPSLASDLTGNWAVKEALGDGTVRATYLNLKQEGAHITGAIRATQFYYRIVESTGGPDGFTLTGSMMDGNRSEERREGKGGRFRGKPYHSKKNIGEFTAVSTLKGVCASPRCTTRMVTYVT